MGGGKLTRCNFCNLPNRVICFPHAIRRAKSSLMLAAPASLRSRGTRETHRGRPRGGVDAKQKPRKTQIRTNPQSVLQEPR